MAKSRPMQVQRILRDVTGSAHRVQFVFMSCDVLATVPDDPQGFVQLAIEGRWPRGRVGFLPMLERALRRWVAYWQQGRPLEEITRAA